MNRYLAILFLLGSSIASSQVSQADEAATILGKCYVNITPYKKAISLAVKQHFIDTPLTGFRAVKSTVSFKKTSPTEAVHRTSDDVLGSGALNFPQAEGADGLSVSLLSTALPAAPSCSATYTVTVKTAAITEAGETVVKTMPTENVIIPGVIR